MASSNYNMRFVVSNEANTSGVVTNYVVTVLADTDHDGIPDQWESDYFGSATGADRNTDSDGDGMSNWAEYVAGTNPTNASSYLKIEQNVAPGSASVRVGTVSGHSYTVQFTDNLNSVVWGRLGNITARPTNSVVSFADPNWTTNRFYRVTTPALP